MNQNNKIIGGQHSPILVVVFKIVFGLFLPESSLMFTTILNIGSYSLF